VDWFEEKHLREIGVFSYQRYAGNSCGLHPVLGPAPLSVPKKYVEFSSATVMAMAISYNWLFLWDYIFYKWGYKYL